MAGSPRIHPPPLPLDSLAAELARLTGASDSLSVTARLLLEHSLASNTIDSYMTKYYQFANFCHRVGQHPLAPTPTTILRYQAHMFESGRVHPRNWRPYLACINRAHDDFGLPAPARHRVVAAASRGALRLAEQQPRFSARPVRRPLPAPVAAAALSVASSATSPAASAAPLAVATATILMVRASSLVHVRPADVVFTPDGGVCITVTIHKTRLATSLVRSIPPASHMLVHWVALLRALVAAVPSGSPLFAFPGQSASAGLSSAVRSVLSAAGMAPPSGAVFSGHSCRGGGATAALAVGVSLPVVMGWGDWKSLTSVVRYIDPLCPPSPAAVALFGHLRRA